MNDDSAGSEMSRLEVSIRGQGPPTGRSRRRQCARNGRGRFLPPVVVAAIVLAAILGTGPEAAYAQTVTASPNTGLTDGEIVTLSYTGLGAGKTVTADECSSDTIPNPPTQPVSATCDVNHAQSATVNPDGTATIQFPVETGPVGTGGGTCDPGQTCYLYSHGAGVGQVMTAITFATAPSTTTTVATTTTTVVTTTTTVPEPTTVPATTTTPATTSTTTRPITGSTTTTTAPVATGSSSRSSTGLSSVNAGSGGRAASQGMPVASLAVLAASGLAFGGLGVRRLVRSRSAPR